jgi:hypothetical protein
MFQEKKIHDRMNVSQLTRTLVNGNVCSFQEKYCFIDNVLDLSKCLIYGFFY